MKSNGPPLFKLLPPGRTGVTFANTITTNDSVNVQSDPYVYNGAGVAVGDIDNDGLPDLFFTGNMVSSRLYLNKGDMRFEDITERAGVKTRSEEHTSELQSQSNLVCRLLLEKKKEKESGAVSA